MTWLGRLITRWRDRPDPGLDKVAGKFGTKAIRPEWRRYDEDKATEGAKRGRTHTETGRPIRRPKAAAVLNGPRALAAAPRLRRRA